jgi:NH3-dependent NAD+ synthetase
MSIKISGHTNGDLICKADMSALQVFYHYNTLLMTDTDNHTEILCALGYHTLIGCHLAMQENME